MRPLDDIWAWRLRLLALLAHRRLLLRVAAVGHAAALGEHVGELRERGQAIAREQTRRLN